MFVLFPSVPPVYGGSLLQPRGPLLLAVPANAFLPGPVSILLIPISQYSYPGETEGEEWVSDLSPIFFNLFVVSFVCKRTDCSIMFFNAIRC